jgi:Zn-dependent alcohol dehydrogenase
MSRRYLLRGAAGAGAVGLAAAAGAGALVAVTRPSTELPPAAKPVAMAAIPPSAMAGPLVVYLRDTTNGEMDVFAGTGQIRLRNPALVGQLLRNLQMAR